MVQQAQVRTGNLLDTFTGVLCCIRFSWVDANPRVKCWHHILLHHASCVTSLQFVPEASSSLVLTSSVSSVHPARSWPPISSVHAACVSPGYSMEKDVCQTPPELEYTLYFLSILLLPNYQLVKSVPPHSVFHVSFLHCLILFPCEVSSWRQGVYLLSSGLNLLWWTLTWNVHYLLIHERSSIDHIVSIHTSFWVGSIPSHLNISENLMGWLLSLHAPNP